MALSATPTNQATYQSSADSTTHTITLGFTPAAGSTLILFVETSGASAPTVPGFNQPIPSQMTVTTGGVAQNTMLYGRAVGNETQLVITASVSCGLVAWVGNWPRSYIRTATGNFGTGTSNSTPVVFALTGEVTVATAGNAQSNPGSYNSGTSSGYTELAILASTGGTATNGYVATKAGVNSTGTVYTNNGNSSTSNQLVALALAEWKQVIDPRFVCGAECGLATVGTLSAGVEHWSAVQGTPTVVTSGPTPMRSTRAFRLNPTAAPAGLQHTFQTTIPSPATMVARFYIYFTSLPTSTIRLFREANSGLFFNATDNTIRGGSTTAAMAASGFAPSLNTWYRIDLKVVLAANQTVDFMVDGNPQTQYTLTTGAGSISTVIIGDASATNWTGDFYIDDIIISGQSGDYPIGDGSVVGIYPNGDKTNTAANPTDGNKGHFYSTTTDFGKGAGGTTVLGNQNAESTSWQSLQNPLRTTSPAQWVSSLVNTATEHLVWTIDTSGLATAVALNGCMFVVTTHSASATANQLNVALVTGTNAVATGGNITGDLSESTIATAITIPSLSLSSLTTDTYILFGDNNDNNPDVFLDGACIEADYQPLVVVVPPPLKIDPYRQLLNH